MATRKRAFSSFRGASSAVTEAARASLAAMRDRVSASAAW
jgi:hypothetical protein